MTDNRLAQTPPLQIKSGPVTVLVAPGTGSYQARRSLMAVAAWLQGYSAAEADAQHRRHFNFKDDDED